MPRIVKRGVPGFLKIQFVAISQKNGGEPSWRHQETFEVIFQEKSKGGPFSLVWFCKCTKAFLAEAGTRTRDRLASLDRLTAVPTYTKSAHKRAQKVD